MAAVPLAVAVFSSREDPAALANNVRVLLNELKLLNQAVVLDVLVNGNRALLDALLRSEAERWRTDLQGQAGTALTLRLWWLALGDKAATINRYLHNIVPTGSEVVLVDGYVSLAPGAIGHMVQGLRNSPFALAASSLPTVGPSAKKLARHTRSVGGMHGGLYALKAITVMQVRRLGFRLPVGLYRTDSTLGAALSFGLGLYERRWAPLERIALVEQAHWKVPLMRWWRARDLQTWWRRRQRQALGDLENMAVRDSYAVRGREFADLPETRQALVERWMNESPDQVAAALRDPRLVSALRQIRQPGDWHLANRPPECVLEAS